MSPLVLLFAALAALGLVLWAYGAREERVSGRSGPATLRAIALFLILAGLALPAFRGRVVGAPERVVLIDASASMGLPVRPGDEGARSRLDSALSEAAALDPDRLYRFGEDVVGIPRLELDSLVAADARTRVRPAFEAARLGGADSVWVVTDGDWGDRVEALEVASGLGLGVREIRVTEPVDRVGIAAVRAPQRARAGDTVRVNVELRATGGAGDSVMVELVLDEAVLARERVERPTAGRGSVTELSFVPLDPGEEAAWRRYEVVLGAGADPLGVSDRVPTWVEISESATGAVLISTAPDWESRFMLPSLERLVLGGARGFMRLADGRYLELDARPRVVEEAVVRRALTGARLLVAQGAPDELPDWLERALGSHPRVLFLPRGAGDVPGAGVRLTGPVPGEWYAMRPIPPSPAAALLTDVDLDPLPPMTELYAVDESGSWTVLTANRGRRGEARPLMIAGERGPVRWAVASGADWWRWASRGGPARRVYDGVLSGVVGWLVEDAVSRLVALVAVPPPGQPLEWRVRSGVTDLAITVSDDEGAEVFSGAWPTPDGRVVANGLPAGRYTLRLGGEGPDGEFASERPLEILSDAVELLPGPPADVASIAPAVQARSAVEARTPRPVWPFALAIALLCVEWVWRHQIGLR
ncbi:MAG: hypothetical protein OEU54_01795 [Gemmatimonadota bacterium]|nr:hypothetical protein [Gemmatimonadota bacterium]